VDEVYRGYCIAIKQRDDGYVGRITSVRGPALKVQPMASLAEGEETCLLRAREAVDEYITFLCRDRSSRILRGTV
jgi:hypothetical protein